MTIYKNREPPCDPRFVLVAEEGLDPSRIEARTSKRGKAGRSTSAMTAYTNREPPCDPRFVLVAEEGLEPPTRGL